MPKPKYNYTTFSVKKLLDDVSGKAKITLKNIADCETLSGKLADEKISISKDTIARLYKIITSKSLPSKTTLNMLSSYVGFQNWDNYYLQFRKETDENTVFTDIKTDIITDNELMLLKFCIEDNAFNPVINYLKKIIPNITNSFGNDAKKISDLICRTTRINPEARKQIVPIITKNKQLRDAVFNWWVDVDGLNVYYANIIESSYLKNLNKLDSDFAQNEIWAYSMLMHNAFYNQNIKDFTKFAYFLFTKYLPQTIILGHGIAVYPFARYHSNHIIYRYFYNPNTFSLWIEEKIKFIKAQILLSKEQEKIIIVSYIIEALSIAKKYEAILYFSDEYMSITSGFIDKNRIIREEDSLIKLIYYFNHARKELNILNEDLQPNITDLTGIEKYITYQHNFSYFHQSAITLFENEVKQKNQYLSEAKKHATAINNKFYLSQIRKETRK